MTSAISLPSNYSYIVHHVNAYGNVSLWVAMNALTFGNVAAMYQYSTSDIRAKVSQNYEHVTEAQLHQFIRVIANCRNVCAHGERLQGKADHVYLLQGGGSRKEKDVMRTQMRSVPDGESVVLVAIDKYVGEGFNYPR